MRKTPLLAFLSLGLLAVLAAPNAFAGVNGWDHVGNGGAPGTASLNGNVNSLYADGTDLYVGGQFSNAGGVASADRIAKWDGTQWRGFAPLNGSVDAITTVGGRLFVGGYFTNASGKSKADFLAVWNAGAWEPFCNAPVGSTFNGNVTALQAIGNTLYVGGGFQNAAGIAAADYLLACDLTTGAASATVADDGDFSGGVYALTADDSGTLYAGGTFTNLDGNAATDFIAAYKGSWSSMGGGPSPGGGPINSFVRALESDGTNVYVGTDASMIGNVAGANHVAKWNGSSWSAMGNNYFSTTTFIDALAVDGPLVFAGGTFQNASGDPTADQIAYWDGSAWHPLGSDGAGNGPLAGETNALATVGARVFAGGSFTTAGGDSLAKYLAASPIRQPDARIGTSATGPFAGNGIYSATGAGESKSITVQRGRRGTFFLKFENDGLESDAYLIHGPGGGNGFSPVYTVAGTNVTSEIKAGTYPTGTLAPGGSITVKLVVSVANSAGNSASFLVRATKSGVPTDAIKAIVKAN